MDKEENYKMDRMFNIMIRGVARALGKGGAKYYAHEIF